MGAGVEGAPLSLSESTFALIIAFPQGGVGGERGIKVSKRSYELHAPSFLELKSFRSLRFSTVPHKPLSPFAEGPAEASPYPRLLYISRPCPVSKPIRSTRKLNAISTEPTSTCHRET
jgi:hypothetical protein